MSAIIRISNVDHNWVHTVGFESKGTMSGWQPLRDFNSLDDAEAYVNYLNGGSGKRWSLTN